MEYIYLFVVWFKRNDVSSDPFFRIVWDFSAFIPDYTLSNRSTCMLCSLLYKLLSLFLLQWWTSWTCSWKESSLFVRIIPDSWCDWPPKCAILEGFWQVLLFTRSYYWTPNTNADDVFGLTVINVKFTKSLY